MDKTRIHIALPTSILQTIDDICDINFITRSQFIRNAIKYYLAYLDDDKGEED